MLRISLPVGDDLLEIHKFFWKGKDAVYWNGELMSSKKRFFTSHHVFRVPNALTDREKMPGTSAPGLDLNNPPRRRAAPRPEPVEGWREEDLIV